MAIAIQKLQDEYNDDMYIFHYADDYGTIFHLGTATIYREHESEYFNGIFDTREISFHDEEELVSELKRMKPNEDVYFLN